MEKMMQIYETLGIDVQERQLGSGINGACVGSRIPCVFVEARLDSEKKLRTLAHELGHAILHMSSEYDQPNAAASDIHKKEQEAECFADGIITLIGRIA